MTKNHKEKFKIIVIRFLLSLSCGEVVFQDFRQIMESVENY